MRIGAVGLSEALKEGRRAVSAHRYAVLALALVMLLLTSADLIEVIPLLAPVAASAPFPFFYEVHDLAALAAVLWAAWRLAPALGIAAGLWFFVLHIPVFYLSFPKDLPDFVRILFLGLVSLFGAFLIMALHRAQSLAEQRLREIEATAQLNLKVFNERVQLLEEATSRGERLARIYRMMALLASARSPLDVAQDCLHLVQSEVDAPYANLTLVNPDGTLGERADSFMGMPPFLVSARPGGLAEDVLKAGQTQYVVDASMDPRANPALVRAGIRSYLGIPFKAEDRVVGVLFLHSTHPDGFAAEWDFLESIASAMGVHLHRGIVVAQIERAKREWETTFDAIGDAAAVMDGERRIVRANRAFAQLVGKAVAELTGKKICTLVHGREDPIPDCPLERAVATGNSQSTTLKEPFLGNRRLDIRVFPIPQREGEAPRYVHLIRVLE